MKLITEFDSIWEWKNYCFNMNRLYLKNARFRKWIKGKEICIFNFSSLKNDGVKALSFGIENAIKTAGLHFKVYCRGKEDAPIGKNFDSAIEHGKINSGKILKSVIKERQQNHNEQASIFVFGNPVKSPGSVIKDGEALTYVSEGVTMFSFEKSKKYPRSFLMCRGNHEALHLFGLNAHHEDTKVKGYNINVRCIMEYNAPTSRLCRKCSDGIISFWDGVRQATGKNV